jgi:hypothetical protein
MGPIRSFYFRGTAAVRILIAMSNDRERVICVTLSEAEWQAFIARQPQPVNWLRDRIRDEVSAERVNSAEGDLTKSAA